MIRNTLVRTPSGARAITELKSGDLVCNEFGKPVKVKQVISRGKESVVDILVSGQPWATCSKEHQWLVKECCGPKQAIVELRRVSDFTSGNRVLLVVDGRPFGFGLSVAISRDEREEETFDLDIDSATSLYLLDNGLVSHTSV